MMDSVYVVDLTQHESPPPNRIRICRFHESKRELTYQWGSEEEIMTDEMSHSMIHVQIDDQNMVTYDTDGDYPNVTAMLFGIRAHGKCYAHQFQSHHLERDFADSLRQWWWCDAAPHTRDGDFHGEQMVLNAHDRNLREGESQRTGSRIIDYEETREDELEDSTQTIQFISSSIGFTPMQPVSYPSRANMSIMPIIHRRRRRLEPEHRSINLEHFTSSNYERRPNPNPTDQHGEEEEPEEEPEPEPEADEGMNEGLREIRNLFTDSSSAAPANISDLLAMLRNDLFAGVDGMNLFADDIFSSTPNPVTPPPTLSNEVRRESPSPFVLHGRNRGNSEEEAITEPQTTTERAYLLRR